MYAEQFDERPVGMNPDFVRRVQAKRREQERLTSIERAKTEKDQQQREIERRRAELKARIAEERRISELTSQYREIEVALLRTSPWLSCKQIIAHVAGLSGVPVEIILGPSRNRQAVEARHQAVRAVADAKPNMSTPAIGRVFNRDHTSILSALKKTRKPGQLR